MTKDDRDYVRGLVRMDIRKKERDLDKFVTKTWLGQTDLEAEIVRSKFRENLEYRRGVLWRLMEEPLD